MEEYTRNTKTKKQKKNPRRAQPALVMQNKTYGVMTKKFHKQRPRGVKSNK